MRSAWAIGALGALVTRVAAQGYEVPSYPAGNYTMPTSTEVNTLFAPCTQTCTVREETTVSLPMDPALAFISTNSDFRFPSSRP